MQLFIVHRQYSGYVPVSWQLPPAPPSSAVPSRRSLSKPKLLSLFSRRATVPVMVHFVRQFRLVLPTLASHPVTTIPAKDASPDCGAQDTGASRKHGDSGGPRLMVRDCLMQQTVTLEPSGRVAVDLVFEPGEGIWPLVSPGMYATDCCCCGSSRGHRVLLSSSMLDVSLPAWLAFQC
jgi:hypothetical protein